MPRKSFVKWFFNLEKKVKLLFLKNGLTPASFCLFSFFLKKNFIEKIVGVSGIRTRIRKKGKDADHLTTTTAPVKLLLVHGSVSALETGHVIFYRILYVFCLTSYMSNIQTIYRIKTVCLSGIRTRIFGAECEHADQLTTTTALQL